MRHGEEKQPHDKLFGLFKCSSSHAPVKFYILRLILFHTFCVPCKMKKGKVAIYYFWHHTAKILLCILNFDHFFVIDISSFLYWGKYSNLFLLHIHEIINCNTLIYVVKSFLEPLQNICCYSNLMKPKKSCSSSINIIKFVESVIIEKFLANYNAELRMIEYKENIVLLM